MVGVEGTIQNTAHRARRLVGVEGTIQNTVHRARRLVGVEGTTEHSTQGKEVGRGRGNYRTQHTGQGRRLVGVEGTIQNTAHRARRLVGVEGTTEHSTQGKEVGRGRGNYRTQHTGQGGW